jgi:serine/threonine protein kinase
MSMMVEVTATQGEVPYAGFGAAELMGSQNCQEPVERLLDQGPDTRGTAALRAERAGLLVSGRYRILRLLGRGGMGAVWLAVDCVLARPVALKESWRPHPACGSGDSPLMREARVACAVSDPGVVQVYDFVIEGDREWIVMEALSGVTLAQTIRQQGRLPVPRVIDIGLRLLETLEAVHREGFLHGDLKPSNVQLDGTGRAVLTDFGLASGPDVAGERGAGPVMGSPPYLAPEVIRTGIRSPASDLFALGATLYEAAAGRRRFDDGSAIATALDGSPQVPAPALDGGPVGQVIDQLMTSDPRRRLPVVEARAWLKEIEAGLVRPTSGVGGTTRLVVR